MKKIDAKLWLESTNLEDVPPCNREFLKYFKDLMSGKTPSKIRR